MNSSHPPLDSDALRANLARTSQEVEVPERFGPLFEVVEGYFGVRKALTETLTETFHPFRNVETVIELLQTLLLRHGGPFQRHPRRSDHVHLLLELPLNLFEAPLDTSQSSSLLRTVLLWAISLLEGPHAADNEEALREHWPQLAILGERYLEAFQERSPQFRDLLRLLQKTPSESILSELLRNVLGAVYRRVAEQLDAGDWSRREGSNLQHPKLILAALQEVSAQRMDTLQTRLASATTKELLSDEFPTLPDLLEQTLAAIPRIDSLDDRFATCLFLLKDPTLGYRQREVLVTLLSIVRERLGQEKNPDFARPIEQVTRFFRERKGLYPEMRFRCYQTIGEAIGEANNHQAADLLTDKLLAWPFEYPEIRGATDEWQTIVNPLHLAGVRCWLRIIGSNPFLFERLAAALTVQLRLGGVFLADTDLFQRDISRFLACPIGPIYSTAKQLLRSFPIFYNEVGAEGELRSVSTELDEICGRNDSLMHFLRKQVHAESSNRLVRFSRAVIEYWANLDLTPLETYLPESIGNAVSDEDSWAVGPHQVLLKLRNRDSRLQLDELVDLPVAVLEKRLSGLELDDTESCRRLVLLVRLHQLLVEKYSLDSDDPEDFVERHLSLPPQVRNDFQQAFDRWKTRATKENTPPDEHTRARQAVLDASLSVLEALRTIILSPDQTDPVENLLHKRHIAAGIPSIYGHYNEPKFDALGLTFRLEQLLSALLEEEIVQARQEYVTGASLREMASTLRRFERALGVDGIHSQNLSVNLHLLEVSFEQANFSFHQYLNIFQFLAGNISDLARLAVIQHDGALRIILNHDNRPLQQRGLHPDALAETILRDLLVSGVGLQNVDRYVSTALRRISTLTDRLDPHALTRMMNYDPEQLVTWIHESDPEVFNQITLGSKALSLCRLAAMGYRVPRGFILSTELFRARRAMTFKPFYEDTLRRIRRALDRMESEVGLQLGNPESLLMLSIRSGAAISMPGQMSTFINVGLNESLVEALASQPGFEWMAWDSYRRFLQSWAMSEGIERDVFDSIISDFKEKHDVEIKLEFTPEQMHEIALAYRQVALTAGVTWVDDPFEQVVRCVFKVLDSWDAPQARDFRSFTGVAEDWGTAVIVQHMVHGNLGHNSGAGVTFTRNPQQPQSRKVGLFGDFAICSQGEDLVGGLVFPLPISEAQRQQIPAYQNESHSLERDFPEIFGKLDQVAKQLVREHNYDDLEMEFTFESPRAEDLYLLQKRPMVTEFVDETAHRVGATQRRERLIGVGLGVAGGFFQGRIAIDKQQIDRLSAESPNDPLILLRPDTVPEDLAMIVRAGGLLTARGGSTSHAAVTAKRLGKVAVVDCRALQVLKNDGKAILGEEELEPGEWISIDGRTGHIYRGRLVGSHHP